MLKFGIWSIERYLREGEGRRYYGPRVSYALLDVGDHPSAEYIRVFEDVSFTLRTSNGTFRTTFRQRFNDVNAAALKWAREFYAADTVLRVEDRAASHCLTSWEWAVPLFQAFPQADFEASDVLLHFLKLSLDGGETYVVEPSGQPLQYIHPPFVVPLAHAEARRYPLNRLVSAWGRRRFERLRLPEGWMESSGGPGFSVSRIPYIHPKALEFSRTNPRFRFRERSVFEPTPGVCHVLRTMNIFNKGYFSDQQLAAGAQAVFDSLQPGGIWVVGRTLEEDLTNHATLFRRLEDRWMVLERIGRGSEIEDLALGSPARTGTSG